MQKGSLKVVKDRRGVKVWRAQWRENGRGRTRILGTFADVTRADARNELGKILAPVNAHSAGASNHSSLRSYVENEYLVSRSRKWKASTVATTEQIIGTHILSELGTRPLTSITRSELQSLLDHQADAGLSLSVVGHTRWQLQAIFEMAQGDGLITVNPTNGLVTPRCKAQPDKTVMDVPDVLRAQLVLTIRDRVIFRLAVCEGMRPGEIMALQIQDIREDGIHIERRLYRGRIDTPKSSLSRRVIPPTATTAALITAYLDFIGKGEPASWLFASENPAMPLSYSNVFRRSMQPALRSIGIERVNFQILRRTWVTEFSEVEDDAALRAKLAGHSVNVHENEYRQPKTAELQRSMDKLDKRLQ